MGAVDLAADTHALVALLAEQFVFVLFMVEAIAKIEDWFLAKWLPLVFTGYLVFMMLKVAFLAEVCLFGEAVVSSNNV